MPRTKTDEEILQEVALKVSKLFAPKVERRGRPKGPTGSLYLWKVGNKWFRHKKNAMEAGNATKHDFDADYLLEVYYKEGFEYHVEDMTHDEYIKTLKEKAIGDVTKYEIKEVVEPVIDPLEELAKRLNEAHEKYLQYKPKMEGYKEARDIYLRLAEEYQKEFKKTL